MPVFDSEKKTKMDKIEDLTVKKIASGDAYSDKVIYWYALNSKIESLRSELRKSLKARKVMKEDSRLMTLVGNIERFQAKEDLENMSTEGESEEEEEESDQEETRVPESEGGNSQNSKTRITIRKKSDKIPKKKETTAKKRLQEKIRKRANKASLKNEKKAELMPKK